MRNAANNPVPVEFVPLDPPRGRDRAQALLDALLLLCQQLVHDLCEAEGMDEVGDPGLLEFPSEIGLVPCLFHDFLGSRAWLAQSLSRNRGGTGLVVRALGMLDHQSDRECQDPCA